MKRLRTGEIVAGVSALALFGVMFLDWYRVTGTSKVELLLIDKGRTDTSFNAWQSFHVIDIVLLFVIALALALVGLTVTQRSVALPVGASVVTTFVGAIAFLLVLFRIIDPPANFSVKAGAWLGLLASAGIVAGAWLSLRDEGNEPPPPLPPPIPAPAVASDPATAAPPPPPPVPAAQEPGSTPPPSAPPPAPGGSAPPP